MPIYFLALLLAQSADFSAARWNIRDPDAKQEEYLGRPSLYLKDGLAVLKDVNFEDGTIDVDMAAPKTRAFMAVIFRTQENPRETENIYLRAHKSGWADALQYMPSFGPGGTWQLFHGDGYTNTAEIPQEKWIHVRIVVSGLDARLYLDNADKPALTVTGLRRGYSHGSVGLWAGVTGAHFANFRVTPDRSPKPKQPIPVYRPPPNIVAHWELSQRFKAEEKDSETYPAGALQWQPVAVEDPGMVVIDRYRQTDGVVPFQYADRAKHKEVLPGKKLVFARAVVYSDRDQLKKMNLGYSDEVTVFVNRQPVFTGRSSFLFRDPGFLGNMDVENDAVFMPLKRGRNELMLAVSDYFGGWGLICRFADMSGLKFDSE